MVEIIINKILPIIVIYFIGFFLKELKVFNKKSGSLFLKLVFYLGLPSLIITSFSKIEISKKLFFIPLSAGIVFFSIFFISLFFTKFAGIKGKDRGVFLISTMIMNIGFVLPFFITVFGEEGLAKMSLFNFGNGFLVMTFAYVTACRYGGSNTELKNIIKKVVYSPPIWAIIIGLMLNVSRISIPVSVNNILTEFGNTVVPLTMLALGIFFNLRFENFKISFSAFFIRTFVGLIIGCLMTVIFGLKGLNGLTVIVGASAPVGYNTLTFSTMEDLNVELAASVVSISIIFSLFFVPFLILILK
ncbi:MAG: AEC family transporter [Candidatus Mcinerneyibacterium aminivorans]|jgi:hypothetical protein|uniref:AEC family transporter n=1 Tax=Candidatus Mcinerneyibacterium aminivorans TaxID=2703815 RepID=A0A5D0MLG8_9BACT|nr:MAG: AEC family transporter [Candidatus Mcinerneyibacterium aminivorans]